MARKFVVSLDLNKNELLNARIHHADSTGPSSPVTGQIYYDTTNNIMRFWNGTAWISMSGDAEVIQDTVSSMFVAGIGLDKTYDDNSGTLTIDIDSSVTTNTGAQTLTNKTITNPTVSGLTLSDATISFEGVTPNAYQTFLTATDPTQDRTITLKDASGTVAFTSDIPVNTDGLSEGSTNLYYTAERVQDEINNTIIAGTGLDKTYDDGAGTYTLDIDSTVTTNSGTQTLTNKTLGSGNALSANLDAATYKITNLGTPTASGDAVNKSYVDGLTSGLDWKTSVNVLADSNVPLTGSTPLSVDSHTLSNGYRVLLKNQSTNNENGIYDLTITGGSYTLTRSADADAYGELIGAAVFVMEGTVYAATSWVQSNHYITDFASQSWVQFSGAGTYLAGSGLTLTGNTFSVDTTPSAGNASLEVSNNALNVKTDTSRGLSVDANGLGINAGTGLTFSTGALTFASGYGVRKFSENISNTTAHVATHNFSTRDVTVAVYDNSSPYAEVFPDIEHTSTNTVTIRFATAPTADQYRVVIIG